MFQPPAIGWQPDIVDFRDLSIVHPSVQALWEATAPFDGSEPSRADLRQYFPPIETQPRDDVSAACAGAALVEYFTRRATGSCLRVSTRFLWLASRRLQQSGPLGMRAVFKTLTRIGMPPQRFTPDALTDSALMADPFLFSFPPLTLPVYFRVDSARTNGRLVVHHTRRLLAANIPTVIGFSVPDSISAAGTIPYRPLLDAVIGGQAVVIVGYDDTFADSCVGAFRIRNSWGSGWGDAGYGWLPYRYVESGLASDVWTILTPDWLASGEFFNPALHTVKLASTG